MTFPKILKEYIERIWPEIISICCSIIIFLLSKGKPNVFWAILIIISPVFVGLPIRCFFLRKRAFFNEKSNHQMVRSIKQLRDYEKKFPKDNTDGDKFAQTMVDICDTVCQTIIGADTKINVCTDYCVVVYLGVLSASGKTDKFSPLYSDNSKMSEHYMKEMGSKILLLDDNTSFNDVYNTYCNKTPHTPKITTVSNIKNKIKRGTFHSTFLKKGISYRNMPYNSMCVFPILPFHNPRKGDEMQGFVSIMSKRRNTFKDSEIANEDFSHYLESVSGVLYDICIKDKSKDKTIIG